MIHQCVTWVHYYNNVRSELRLKLFSIESDVQKLVSQMQHQPSHLVNKNKILRTLKIKKCIEHFYEKLSVVKIIINVYFLLCLLR